MRFLILLCLAASLPGADPSFVNPSEARWEKSKGSESITLRDDAEGTELLARYPGGHEFTPHWHSGNERIVLVEGKLLIGGKELEPGAYAFLPAKQVQRMKCVSQTRCAFYVSWDKKLDFHPAE